MRLPRASKRLRVSHALVLGPALAVVGVWVFILVAPSLPAGVLSSLVTSPSDPAPPTPEPRELTEEERLELDWLEAYRQRNFPQAIELGLRLNKLAPENTSYAYNLACTYSLNAEPDKAARCLARAAENGFSLLKLLETDPDLESMRSHAGYQAVLAVVKETRAAYLADLGARFEQQPMHVVLPPEYDKDEPAPLIVALHGKGGRAPGIAEEWRNVAAEMGAIVIAPQAVYPFAGSSGFTWMGADTLDSLCDDAEHLVRLTFEFAVKNYLIDEERTVLTGFSEGGFVSQGVGPRAPYLFTCVIPMGCSYIRGHDAPPKAIGDRPPRFYFMTGERDLRIVEEVPVAAKDYTAAGFESAFRIYPKVGHRFPIDRDRELRKALDFVLER